MDRTMDKEKLKNRHNQDILEKKDLENNYLCKLGENLNDMRKNNFLTDVALVCKDTHIFAHKSILAATGGYFTEIFQSEPLEETIDLGIEPNIVEILLDYIYTGVLYIPDNIEITSVLASAVYLRMDAVITWCSKLMLRRINGDNIFEFLSIAEKFDIGDMKQAILNHVPSKFKQLVESETFCKLPLEYATTIIKLPNLKCTEDEKFDAILKWIRYDEPKRVEQTEALGNLIDVARLSLEFLTKLTDDSLILNDIRLMQAIMKEMSKRMKSLTSHENKNETTTDNRTLSKYVPRNASPSKNDIKSKNISVSSSTAVMNVSQRASSNKTSPSTPFTVTNKNVTTKSTQLTPVVGNRTYSTSSTGVSLKSHNANRNSCDFSGNTIAAFSIEDGNYTLFCQALNGEFQNSQDGSIRLPVQTENIRFPLDASVCVYGNIIFFFGGRSERSWRKLSGTLAYDVTKNTWEGKADMSIARSDTGCAVFDDEIYVVGGISQDNTRQRLVERYDPSTNCWHTLAPMNMCREKPSLSSLNEHLYVVGSYYVFPNQFKMRDFSPDEYASGEIYDPYTNQWTLIETKLPVGRLLKEKEYRITSLAGRLFALSTHTPPNDPENLHFFYEYFPISNTWKQVKCDISLKSIVFIAPYDRCLCIVDEEGTVLMYSLNESEIMNASKINIGLKSLQYATCVKL